MSVANLVTVLLILLSSQACRGGEKTKNIACANLRTGNAYRYCVDVNEESKRILCVEWMSMIPNGVTSTTDDTSMWLAELFQHKNTTQAPNVIDVNYSCITLPECVNIDHIVRSDLTVHLTHFIVSGASACTLVNISCGQLKSSDGRYVYPYIPGVFDIAVFNMNGTAIANSGGDKPMEFDKNEVVTMNNSSLTLYKCQSLKMNLIYSDATQQKAGTESNGEEPSVKERCSHYIVTEMKNEVVTTATLNSTIIPDGDNPDSNRGDTSLTWKIIVGIVVSLMLVIAGLLFFCVYKPWRDKQRNQGHRDVEEVQGSPDPNSIPLMQNERRDSRVNDETKEVTPGAQSLGPPQINGGPPMSNRAAEETTALLDKQALDKDQVTKPRELIDQGPNDMESRRGEL